MEGGNKSVKKVKEKRGKEKKVSQKKMDKNRVKGDKQTWSEESKNEESVKDRNTMVTVDDMDSQPKKKTMAIVDPNFLSDRDSLALLENSLTMVILR